MLIKLDENIPHRAVGLLTKLGHEVDTVPAEGLTGTNDAAVFTAAQNAARFLITRDLDFSNVRKFRPGTHHGILLVRLLAPGRQALLDRIGALFSTEDTSTWGGCFLVATDTKLRIRKPK